MKQKLKPEVAKRTLEVAVLVTGMGANADMAALIEAVKAEMREYVPAGESPDDASIEREALRAVTATLKVLKLYHGLIVSRPATDFAHGQLQIKS